MVISPLSWLGRMPRQLCGIFLNSISSSLTADFAFFYLLLSFCFLGNTSGTFRNLSSVFEKPYFIFFTRSSMFFTKLFKGSQSNSTARFCLVTLLRGLFHFLHFFFIFFLFFFFFSVKILNFCLVTILIIALSIFFHFLFFLNFR